MKVHLIFPPLWECDAPYSGIPYLYAYLKRSKIDVSAVDLNIKIQNEIFTENTFIKTAERLRDNKDTASEKQIIIKKALALYDLVGFGEFEAAKERLKAGSDIHQNVRDKKILEIGRFIYSAQFYPDSFNSYQYLSDGKEVCSLTQIIKAAEQKSGNIFYALIKKYVDQNNGFDVVGLSVASVNQLIPALTIAKYYKEIQPSVKVVMGGAIIPYLKEAIEKNEYIFKYLDCIISGEGETPLLKWIGYLSGKNKITEVPNLIYKSKNGEVISSEIETYEDIDELPTPDYSFVNWNDYFTPKRFISYLTSRGCYWNNCSFCGLTSNYGQKFRLREMDKVLEDIKTLCNENHTQFMIFNDEALTTGRLNQISEKILKWNLKLYWCCLCRLDSNHNKEVFEKAFSAGLRIVSFGLESGSQRVLDLMNKGVQLEKVPFILESSSKCGIWNNLYLMLGFPGETIKDIEKSENFLIESENSIDSLGCGEFRLDGHSKVYKEPDKYAIHIDKTEQDFFGPNYPFSHLQDRQQNGERIKNFETRMDKYSFAPSYYLGVDLNMLLINLAWQNKEHLCTRAIVPLIEKKINGTRILNGSLSGISISQTDINYKKINNGSQYSYIFYSIESGSSVELAGDIDDILYFISNNRQIDLTYICNKYCDKYETSLQNIEGFIRTLIFHLYNHGLLNIKIKDLVEDENIV